VLLNPAVSCGHCEYCLSGDHGTCRQRCRLGTELDGGYAEFVKAPGENVHEIPEGLTFEEAAAIPVAFFTAWHLLITRAQLRAGETVMVTGAGGSVGSAAMQIARWAGARAFAAVGSEWKLERAKQLGADGGVNYGADDLTAGIRRLTDGRGVDIIADTVGASLWEHNLASLAVGGRLVVCGFRGGGDVHLNVSQLIGPRLNILGSGPLGSKVEVSKVMEAVNRGEFHGIVDRTFPLADAKVAHSVIESRDFFGKLILVP
jgi:NADPH2:quinone reductase